MRILWGRGLEEVPTHPSPLVAARLLVFSGISGCGFSRLQGEREEEMAIGELKGHKALSVLRFSCFT